MQSTNDDATACKWSAVNLGYWADPFINFMAKKGERRAPEIHLGEENDLYVTHIIRKKLKKKHEANQLESEELQDFFC